MPVDAVRPLVPAALEVERHEGHAWITLIPFLIAESRPAWLPRMLASAFLETNLRTYVRGPDGEHGIYFFSLEAESLPAVAAARLLYGLPYFFAAMSRRVDGGRIVYASRRRQPRRVGHPLRGGSQLHHSIRWHSMVATARCGIGRRHRADLAAGVVKFLSADVEGRRRWLRERRASGTRGRLDELLTSFGAPRQTSRSRERGSRRAAMAKN